MAGAFDRAKSVKGAEDFLALSKRLKVAGQTDLRKELHKTMRNLAKPVARKVKESAADNIGRHRGGIGEHYAKKPVRPQLRTGAKTAGLRVIMPKTDPRVDSQGRVFHPVFGRRPGVVQSIPDVKGFFSEAAAEQTPEIRDDVRKALSEFAERLTRDV